MLGIIRTSLYEKLRKY
ncbi:hypothetical protein ACRASQ_09280 [Bacteroides hominis]|nr:hypothetical protein [Bacteroides fragilis]